MSAQTRGLADALIFIVLAIGIAMSFIGLVAKFWPPADLPNHFRPFTLLGCVVLTGVLVATRNSWLVAAASLLTAYNLAATLAPYTTAAPQAAPHAQLTLKILSFNLSSGNQQLPGAHSWIVQQDADIVVLQEVTAQTRAVTAQALSAAYPHVYACGCNDLLVATKAPFENAAGQSKSATTPAAAWLDIPYGSHQRFRLMAIRPFPPRRPFEQREHYRWLARKFSEAEAPLIVAGDFNASPWSWKMRDLQRQTGLLRQGTWALSWPANWPAQFVLIDNVLTSPEATVVSFTTGPYLGSDHLPILVTIALPLNGSEP